MRGLAFPTNAIYDREVSYDRDYGTPPAAHIPNVIPIDPALSGSMIDPALMGNRNSTADEQVSQSHNMDAV